MDAEPPPRPRTRLLIDAIVILGIALIGVVTWKLQPRADTALPLTGCDINQGDCAVDLPEGGRLELAVAPRPIPTLKPFVVTLTLRGKTADKVEMDFAGVSMNMGFNRPQLNAAGDGRYVGDATLPVCVTGAMQWQATALLHNGASTLSIPFRFDAGKH